LHGISKLPPPLSSPLEGEDVRRGGIIHKRRKYYVK